MGPLTFVQYLRKVNFNIAINARHCIVLLPWHYQRAFNWHHLSCVSLWQIMT